jgi:hypothetical protein
MQPIIRVLDIICTQYLCAGKNSGTILLQPWMVLLSEEHLQPWMVLLPEEHLQPWMVLLPEEHMQSPNVLQVPED